MFSEPHTSAVSSRLIFRNKCGGKNSGFLLLWHTESWHQSTQSYCATGQVPGQKRRPQQGRRMWYCTALSGLWHASGDDGRRWWSSDGMISRGKLKKFREDSAQLPLRLPRIRISHEMSRDQTRGSSVRRQSLTTWAMARLLFILNSRYSESWSKEAQ